MLSDGTQRRAFPRYLSEEIKILNISFSERESNSEVSRCTAARRRSLKIIIWGYISLIKAGGIMVFLISYLSCTYSDQGTFLLT